MPSHAGSFRNFSGASRHGWLTGSCFGELCIFWYPIHRQPRSGFHLFAEVRDRVVGAGQLDAATFDAASALLDDPNYWTQCWMMTAVWARKPPA